MIKAILSLATLVIITGCNSNTESKSQKDLENEIRKSEADFNKLVQSKGIAEAFYTFADSNAVIKREKDTLIKGKESIKNYYSNPKFKNAKVSWSPDYVSVSQDGTLGYTYGKYIWSIKDSLGKTISYPGVFHTVWKKQRDGSWKYTWD